MANNIILFHDFKHHLQITRRWLNNHVGYWNEEIHLQIKSMGSSQFDYYIGELSSQTIKEEVFSLLQKEGLIEEVKFKRWIDTNGGFREISISDRSTWVLRYIEKEQYVHLHPSRYAKNTLRMNASTLKTILCTLLNEGIEQYHFDLNKINHYRVHQLKMLPIDIRAKHENLKRSFALFTQERINE